MPARGGAVRYAVVGLGHIAQVAMLPAFAHARRNSRLTALVSDDRAKLKALAARYQVQDVRIVEALYKSAKTGKAVKLPPFTKTKRPTGKQRITRPGVRKPALVKVKSASE